MILDPRLLDELSQEMADRLPKGLQSMKQDLEKHLRLGLETALSKMDLVTREEFEIQTAVLARTRAKLEALEKRVAALEQNAAGTD